MLRNIANNQLYKTITTIVELIITILLVVLIILTGFQRFSEKGSFFGYRIFTVASGSMIPMYEIGDTLLIKNVPIDDIKIGDAVTYQSDVAGLGKVNITHEVIDVEIDQDTGKYSFHTKGIANNIEDPIVGEEQVVGKVIHRFFFLSLIGYVTTSKALLMIFITIPLAILIAIEVIRMLYGDEASNHIVKKVLSKNQAKKLVASESKILTEEERQRKIEAIRNGSSANNNHSEKKFGDTELARKIEAIKNGEKLNEDVEDNDEHKSIEEILENRRIEEPQEEKEDDFIDTIKKLKENQDKYDDDEMDEILSYLKEKMKDEK